VRKSQEFPQEFQNSIIIPGIPMEFYANFFVIPKIIPKNFKIDHAVIPAIISPSDFWINFRLSINI
jgi:hypothetical protein